MPPHFRLTAPSVDSASVETLRPDGSRQLFRMVDRGGYWESRDEIPEPHGFRITISLEKAGKSSASSRLHEFAEHSPVARGQDTIMAMTTG